MRRPRLIAPALVVSVLLLTPACGQEELAPGTYAGDLVAQGRQGAAGRVVECDGPAEGGNNRGEYDNGALSDDPETALRTAFDEGSMDGVRDGYRLVREDDDRALFTFTHEGAVRQAAVVRDGEAFGDEGWYVESWARCDYAELPAAVAEERGIHLWSDAIGTVPTTTISSTAGSEHCDWQRMTFLVLDGTTYVGGVEAEYAEWVDAPYAARATLPAGAVDTGYHRGDDHLWLSADGTRAYVGDRGGVAIWPRAKDGFGCA